LVTDGRGKQIKIYITQVRASRVWQETFIYEPGGYSKALDAAKVVATEAMASARSIPTTMSFFMVFSPSATTL
jgi:hypothetical protein